MPQVTFIYFMYGVIIALLSALVSAIGSVSITGFVLAGLTYFGIMHWYTWDMYTRGPSFRFGTIHLYVVSCALLSASAINVTMPRIALIGIATGLAHASLSSLRRRVNTRISIQ